MMITFISQCEKKALSRTRRVLDAFADRIGDRTWQAIITEEGLIAVKTLLRKTVTKNTAVACHWMRSRSRSELVWIVGNRRKFNSTGIVPVNHTQKNHLHSEWESGWENLPAIKALVAVSALLHDWGKASVLFQEKLAKSSKLGDPLRHEWISCLLLNALVQLSGNSAQDQGWLDLLITSKFDEATLTEIVNKNQPKPLDNLPPIAQLVAWLIVGHHRLPCLKPEESTLYASDHAPDIDKFLDQITAKWGYQNKFDEKDFNNRIKSCFEFKNGLLSRSPLWRNTLNKWATRLKEAQASLQQLGDNGAWRLVLHHARLSLMLGDHYFSSLPAETPDLEWQADGALYANTQREKFEQPNTKKPQTKPKQRLDEHLLGVCKHALLVSQSLVRFTTHMRSTSDIKKLKKRSPPAYQWQDQAVDKINTFKVKNEAISQQGCGWFIVNMASTGCGKTFANTKIMRALSEDGESLRFILALGLRTLTLQTGEEYRKNVGLDDTDLAVLIGSSAVKELHEKNQQLEKPTGTEQISHEMAGSESEDLLLDNELNYQDVDSDSPVAEFLAAIIPKHPPHQGKKNRAFLYAPVLVCTIDHIIAATETTRGGKYILPCLRLLSSDLVVDEVDDFDDKDLIAIGRLIHLAGMLGRKVMISSATIPPALAEGFFNAYQHGWRLHQAFKSAPANIACAWVDEFKTDIHFIDHSDNRDRRALYQEKHSNFIAQRCAQLQQQIIKRKAVIVRCDELYQAKEPNSETKNSIEQRYFEHIKHAILDRHQDHHIVDNATGKKVSFGVVRMANISPCVALAKYLMQCEWPENSAPKIMAYHSRQVLLLRSFQEHHLDNVLKRKNEKEGKPAEALSNKTIRAHLNNTSAENVIFILVATPVEEVDRDHDFDWAVIEPSSYRSIIQLVGRVRRHRDSGIATPNVAIMQYNLKTLLHRKTPPFSRPGYETTGKLKLDHHHLDGLLDEKQILHSVNAIPRIQQAEKLDAKKQLADLEHQAISNSLKSYEQKGPQGLQAWLTECWWMTALPQQLNRFRESAPESSLYLVWQEGKMIFNAKDDQGEFYLLEKSSKITKISIEQMNLDKTRLWLHRDYETVLREHCEVTQHERLTKEEKTKITKNSERYGEIRLPDTGEYFEYCDEFGLVQKE